MDQPSCSWASLKALRFSFFASAVSAARKAVKATRYQAGKSTVRRCTPSGCAGFAILGALAPLFHGRDGEVGAFLDSGRPARGHGLGPRVEAEAVRPVLIQVAEAGRFPAADGIVGQRDRKSTRVNS